MQSPPPDRLVTLLGSAQSFLDLGVMAFTLGLEDRMQQPARGLWERALADPHLAERVRSLLGDFAESPLIHILKDRDVWRRLKRGMAGHERSALLRAARSLITGTAPEPPPPPPAPPADLPPRGERDLERWAEERSVADLLDCVAMLLAPRILARHPSAYVTALDGFTIRDTLLGNGQFRAYGMPAVRPFAESWLAEQVTETKKALEEERAAALLPPAPEGVLAQLDACLDAARPKLRAFGIVSAPAEVLRSTSLEFREEPPTLLVADPRLDFGRRTRKVLQFNIHGWRDGDLGWFCPCQYEPEPQAPCRHALASVDAARLWLRSGAPAVQQMASSLGSPAWMRTLALIAPNPETETGPQPRLEWRVRDLGGRVDVEAYVRRPSKRGGFTAGTRLSSRDVSVVTGTWISGVDRRAAAAMEGSYGHGGTAGLLALVGAPNVFLADARDRRVDVVETELGIKCVQRDGGSFELVPAIDGVQLPEAVYARWGMWRATSHVGSYLDEQAARCFVVRLRPDVLAALDVLQRRGAKFPQEAADSLAETLGAAGFPAELPQALLGQEVPASVAPSVFLSPLDASSYSLELRVRPIPGGLPLPVARGPQIARGSVDGQRAYTKRDFAGERAAADALWGKLGLELPQGVDTAHLADEAALDAIRRLEAEARQGMEVVWPDKRPTVRRFHAADLKIQVREGRDWFGLVGAAQIGTDRLELAALLDAARRRQRYVKISETHWAELTEDLQQAVAPLSAVAVETKNGMEVSLAAASLLEALEVDVAEVEACESFRAMAERIRGARAFEPVVPPELTATLRPYQREGFHWLARLAQWGPGACLADDMGLGKTLQALALMLHRRQMGPQLVVAPTSVCFNWEREAARFAPALKLHSYHRADRQKVVGALGPGDVLVTSYGLLTRDLERFREPRFATLVLDEAHAVKNSAAQRAKAARALDAQFRLALTGTPLENHLGELWSLFRAAVPGLLGSEEHFRERFWAPIERHQDAARRAALSRILRPFLLRRTKQEVEKDLPPRTEISLEISLTSEERRLYEEARLAAIAELAGADGGPPEQKRFKILAALTRLRLLACHPGLHDPRWDGPASKLEALLGLLEELREEGHRALVFSQFTRHLAKVREALEDRGLEYLYLDGATPERERQARVDRFQAGEGDLFLISVKAGGTGLNLTGADYVVHLDPWWNPAVEDQATDRAHRIGQTKPVTVYRLVTKGTIEEAILALHAQKRELVASVLEGTDVAGRLGTEELAALLERSAAEDGAGED